jgi:hypothetical protein
MRMLSCVRNVTEVLSDRQCSLFSLLEGNRTMQLPEYVNISGLRHTHTHTRDFQLQRIFPQPLFCTQFPQFNYLPCPPILPRFCRPLIRHLLYILQPTITDIMLWLITPALPYCHLDYALAPQKMTKKVTKVKNCGSIHTLRSLPDQGGDVCKVWFRLVQKCEFVRYKQTHKHSALYIRWYFTVSIVVY